MSKMSINQNQLVVKLALLMLVFVFSTSFSFAKKEKVVETNYDIEGVETGTQGIYIVKVYVYTNKPVATTEQIKYAAVHGVLFRGFSGKGFATQKALARPEVETQKSDYFGAFWGNGDYMAYANIVNAVADRIKLSGKDYKYKIGAIVSVSKDSLRKALEDAGIIRGLNTGF